MVATPQISVCIPAYDMRGQGASFLAEAFESLLTQEFKDFEVVVADQSETEDVAQLCKAYSVRLPVTYVKNQAGMRRAAANTNFAMQHGKGRVIKILFQDDYLCDPDALGALAKAFNYTRFRWCVTGSAVTRDGQTIEHPLVPSYHDQIRFGRNTISSPSVLALDAQQRERFDENLVWLMDVDLYHRCHTSYGPPVVLPDIHVVNRLHDAQVSRSVTPAQRRAELAYMKRKAGFGGIRGARSYFLQWVRSYRV
ncbi:glycosyltransferase family 2 protein [Roseovarius phycicola]|uniref:Glycosyltransferase family A protein n=1 Tax=Roseovarius phycicola TaxID=3080976 RepID=A0ABZ2HDZ2_9RHOB